MENPFPSPSAAQTADLIVLGVAIFTLFATAELARGIFRSMSRVLTTLAQFGIMALAWRRLGEGSRATIIDTVNAVCDVTEPALNATITHIVSSVRVYAGGGGEKDG
jgi:hypothetical protein